VATGAAVGAGGWVAAGGLAAGAGDEHAVKAAASNKVAISAGAVRRGIVPEV
jgi:hypothetical protein